MMCSDKLGYIRQPVLSLQLDLSRDGQHERADFELSKEELHKMISSLEAANKVYLLPCFVLLSSILSSNGEARFVAIGELGALLRVP